MELSEWMPWYEEIAQRLHLSKEEDQEATDFLSSLLKKDALTLDEVRDRISGRAAIVFGAGPSLANDLRRLTDAALLKKCCLITADGATTALMKICEKFPDIIATDLDGRVEDQIEATRQGSVVIVHAHGDNAPALTKYVPRLKNRIGSTQVEPRPHVYNFGGFTDGDRAAFAAVELGTRALVLAGMDFGNVVGEYSKSGSRVSQTKMVKMEIGLELLAWLSTRTGMPLYNVTERGVDIQGFRRVRPEELRALL